MCRSNIFSCRCVLLFGLLIGLIFRTSDSSAGQNTSSSTIASGPACIRGDIIPQVPTLLLPPSVPQPKNSNDVVGLIFQNNSAMPIAASYATFGQIFQQGAVGPSDTLYLNIAGENYPLQLDALALWPGGSVKLAALTISTANLCANTQVSAMIEDVKGGAKSTPVSLSNFPVALSTQLVFTAGGTNVVIDLAAALKTAIAMSPQLWLSGPLASQARVDVPVPGTPTLHVTADITAYADGNVLADIQYNNDITNVNRSSSSVAGPLPPLNPLQYTATISVGKNSFSQPVSQDQYTSWHIALMSNGYPPMLVSPLGGLPQLNVQHDIRYLENTGAILPYSLTTGVLNNAGAMAMITSIISGNTFGAPMSGNGVSTYMPTTGGRGDIGFTTQYNTVWLVTQDVRAAAVALAQSDTGGAIPWNFKLSNGHWLTPYDFPNIWTDNRGGPYSYTDGLTNAVDQSTWVTDTAHQPNLSYIPYIMTGTRWYLDRLNAQAANSLSNSWPTERCPTAPCNSPGAFSDIVLDGQSQVRSQAWSFREIKEASFVGKTDSFEQIYYTKVVSDNWNYVSNLMAQLTALEGEATGWMTPPITGAIRGWQEDYLSGVIVLAAEMGDQAAGQFLNWQVPWLTGRFIAPDFNPYDGCLYYIIGANATSSVPYPSWRIIETLTIANGVSMGPNSPNQFTTGDYCELARGVLGGALTVLPNNIKLQKALTWMNNIYMNPETANYAADLGVLQQDPTFNIVPLH